jgi:hypothetical protein
MTRRRLLCGLLLASVVLACFAGWLVIASGPRVSRARFERVKEGMSREEVIRTVGGPPGDYSSGPALSYPAAFSGYHRWLADDGELLVLFDVTDTAANVVMLPGTQPTLTERIRRWLGL